VPIRVDSPSRSAGRRIARAAAPAGGHPGKRPFDIATAVRRIREAVRPLPMAAMFALAAGGYGSLFEQLVACVLSIRTRDEVSLVAARRLFSVARTLAALARLSRATIDRCIADVSFHAAKAAQLGELARRVVAEQGGSVPCDETVVRSFRGIGPKCANLALGIACGARRISVDVHVHRITNRWGYVRTRTPEKTLDALEARLPPRYWIELNALLVPFGKHICTGRLPRCSTCPVLDMCRQVGVTTHR
jgi:endonuclease-3